MTESTGVVVGGDLVVENVGYLDCGNSVLQVNKDLRAKLLITVGDGDDPGDAVQAYFEKYEQDEDEEDDE